MWAFINIYNIMFVLAGFINSLLIKKLLDVFLGGSFRGHCSQEKQSMEPWKISSKMVLGVYGLLFLCKVVLSVLFRISFLYEFCCVILVFLVTFLYQGGVFARLWATVSICSVEFACLLIPYFMVNGELNGNETIIGTFLFLLCYVPIRKMNSGIGKKEELEKRQYLVLLLVPSAGLLAMFCLWYSGVSENIALCQYASLAEFLSVCGYGNGKSDILLAVCCVCILAGNLSVFYLYDALLQNDVHIRQRDSYRWQIFAYKNQMEVIRESDGRIRALRHDMKNHLLHIEARLWHGQYKETLAYLERMKTELQNPDEYAATGNEELDSLLNYKLRMARQRHLKTECNISVPKDSCPAGIPSYEINVILGNLLDNAVEAAGKSEGRWIRLMIRADRGIFMIYLANSFEGESALRENGSGFLSTKDLSGEHGIGLGNVRRMVEQLNGEIEIRHSEGVFEVEVMLYQANQFNEV